MPRCLVVMLKRFSADGDKLQTPVHVSTLVELQGIQYDLKAVVCHEGESLFHAVGEADPTSVFGGGHYVVYLVTDGRYDTTFFYILSSYLLTLFVPSRAVRVSDDKEIVDATDYKARSLRTAYIAFYSKRDRHLGIAAGKVPVGTFVIGQQIFLTHLLMGVTLRAWVSTNSEEGLSVQFDGMGEASKSRKPLIIPFLKC